MNLSWLWDFNFLKNEFLLSFSFFFFCSKKKILFSSKRSGEGSRCWEESSRVGGEFVEWIFLGSVCRTMCRDSKEASRWFFGNPLKESGGKRYPLSVAAVMLCRVCLARNAKILQSTNTNDVHGKLLTTVGILAEAMHLPARVEFVMIYDVEFVHN